MDKSTSERKETEKCPQDNPRMMGQRLSMHIAAWILTCQIIATPQYICFFSVPVSLGYFVVVLRVSNTAC